MKILIIDDDEEFFEATKESILLEESFENFEVDHSFSGEDGLVALEVSKHDIVITDYDLGSGIMCGLDIVKAIVEKDSKIPVIVLTAQGDMERSIECYRNGAIDFVDKNMEHELFLIKAIYHALNVIDKNRAEDMKNELRHILIHDLKTPLTCISSSLDVIKIKHQKFNIQDERLDSILRSSKLSCRQMLTYINNTLFLEHTAPALEKEKFNLKMCIDSFTNLLSVLFEMNKLDFQFTYSGDEEIFSNEMNIEHIMFNILSNAIQHSLANNSIRMNVANNNTRVDFEITNTGSVIPEGCESRVFDKEFTSHSSKMNQGFGLSYCKKAIETLGGKIRVNSDYTEQATTFKFHVPLSNN